MPLWSILACGMAFLLDPAKAANAEADTATLSPEVREVFAWYETLGYPNLADLPWIGVLPGSEVETDDPFDRYTYVPTRGFLLSDDGKRFAILLPDLRQRFYTRKTVTLSVRVSKEEAGRQRKTGKYPTPPTARVRWDEASLEADAKALLALGRQFAATPEVFTDRKGMEKCLGRDYPDHRSPLRVILFVMAHACYERKLTALAGDLCATADLLPSPVGNEKNPPDLMTKMQWDLGYLAIWRAVEAVGGTEYGLPWDPAEARPLQSRRQLFKRFRDFAEHYPRSEHVPYAKEIAAVLESMAAEDATHVTPAEEELAGLPVDQQVQELIFQLRDHNGHQWITPDECDIFDDYFHEHHPKVKRDSTADRLVAIGMPAVPQLIAALDDKRLTRTVACWRGYTYSHTILTVGECAEAVVARIAGRSFEVTDVPWPQRAAARRKLLMAWWMEVQVKGERQTLIDNIASGQERVGGLVTKLQQKWPEALADSLLLGVQNASNEWIRKDFIGHLAGLKNEQATAFLLKEMRQGSTPPLRVAAAEALRSQGHPEAMRAMLEEWRKLPRTLDNGWDAPFSSVLRFLMESPSVPVIQGLAKALPERSLDERIEIIRTVIDAPAVAVDSETLQAIEHLLVHALDDSQVRLGSESNDDFDLEYPHPGDYALFALNRHFPQRYSFSKVAGRRQRDRERGVAINQWRATQGLPARTLPLNNLSPLPPQQSLQIVEVRIESSPGISERVRKSFENLKGTAFNPALFTETATDFANTPGNGGGGLALEAYRESDLKGVSVIVTALPPRIEGSEWVTSCGGKIGSESIGYGEGAASAESLRGGLWWNDFLQETAATLEAAAPTEAFLIVLSLECPQ